MESPYKNLPKSKWLEKTKELVNAHPLKDEIKDVVLKSWNDIFNSKIGSFRIGKEIFPSPQILSFFLHELVAHYLSLKYPERYKVGELKNEKDVHDIINPSMGIEIKGSSNATQIFANRSYAQPSSDSETKDKNGYYITINFEKVSKFNPRPKIKIIRFGYLEHKDWIAKVTSGANRSSIERTSHPAQFPEDLIKRLMLGFTNQNNLVLDPFMGSGTVASVSVELKRKFLGFEIEPNYCEIAKKRIQLKIQKCTTLFDNIPETNAIVPETAK